MNTTLKEKNRVKTAPAWRQRVLLVLLVISATAGVALNLPAIQQSATGFPSLFKKATGVLPGKTITCQGMLVGENGAALAFIDGQTVKGGDAVSGVQVLEITATRVLVGRNGETCLLGPGESFTPGKK